MSLIKSSVIIHINSKFRTQGSDDDFYYQIELAKNNKYSHVAVLSISIPKSYYLISEGENTFQIIERDVDTNDIVLDETITFPIGNYSITSFLYILNNLFTGALSNYSAVFPNSKTEAQTGKITFSHTNPNISEFKFQNNHLPEVMGFERDSTNGFVLGALTSKNICNFQKESTLFLHSNCSDNINDDILLEMFSSGSPDLSNINFENRGNLEEHSKLITSSQNNNYRFYLTDEFDKKVDLNGVNMLITLCFYEKQNINKLIRRFIKYKTLLDKESLRIEQGNK